MNYETFKGFGIGFIIAIIVLILCVVFWAIGKPLDNDMVLLLIALLAIARLT